MRDGCVARYFPPFPLQIAPLFFRLVKRRLAKYLAIAAIVLVLLVAAGGWFMDRWLQSSEAHANIEGKLSEALHMPVKIERLGFSAWSGLTAKKIIVSSSGTVLFEAAGISAGHRFAPLLRGSFALGEVRIEHPHFRMIQDASGKWGMPQAVPQPQPGAAAIAIAPVSPQPPSTAAAPAPAKDPAISIGKIIIEGGTLEFIDKSNAPFLTVAGMNVTLRDVTEAAFSGDFSAARVTLHGWFALDHLSGITTHAGREFQIRKLGGDAGGGSVTGEATWIKGATGSAALKFAAINLDRAAQNAGANARKIAGVLGGDAQFTGLGADTKAISGKGMLALKGGDCSQFEVLRQIGDALRLATLANFQIADATANFQVANGQMILAPMDISAPPAGLALSGPIGFDGALGITAFLHMPADLVEKQGSMLAERFSSADARGRRGLPFNITGSLSKPRQNLAESLTGTKDRKQQRIIAVETILSTILQKKNPKLLKMLPQLVPPPQPAPPAPAPPQP